MAMQWVEYFANENTKTTILRQIEDFDRYPFEQISVREPYTWTSNGRFLRLNMEGTLNPFREDIGGGAKFEVSDNWRVKMRIITENNDYFNDNIKGNKQDVAGVTVDNDGDIPNQPDFFQSQLSMTRNGKTEDYISLDLDGDHSGIAKFACRVDGDMISVSSPESIRNETYIEILKIEHYEDVTDLPPEDSELQDEAFEDLLAEETGDTDFTGDGDLDGGGSGGSGDGGGSGDEDKEPATFLDYALFVGIIAMVGVAIGLITLRGGK